MYKTKLQELCHQRAWMLPDYTTTREGPPHKSRFQASVNVNGLDFFSSAPARSAKLAQNDAAFVAFTHFSSPAANTLVNELSSGEGTAMKQNAPAICQTLQTATPQNAPEIGQTLQIATPQNAPEISQILQTATQQSEPEISQTLQTSMQKNGLGIGQTLQSLGVGVAADVGGLVGVGAAVNMDGIQGSSPLITAPETDQILKNKGVSVAESGATLIGDGSSTVIRELNTSGRTTQTALETCQTQRSGVFAIANNDNSSTDMHHLSKNQLQSYAQKRQLSLPIYFVEREGPPHACRFRCNVIVDGKTYESKEFYPSLNKAEAAAARVALMSLSPSAVEQDECSYKNLLQELAQKMGYQLPTYTTSKSGQDHVPSFVSKVEVGGECFNGQEARNKKQAESSVAKIAYTTLKQRNAPSAQGDIAGKPGPSHVTQQLVSHKRPDLAGIPNENLTCLPPSPKRQEVQSSSTMNRADYIAFLQQNVQPSMPIPEKQVEVFSVLDRSSTSRSVSSSSGTSFSSTNELSQSWAAFASNSSSGSTICSSIEHLVKASNTCKIGVVIHPRQSSISYPSSGYVLPVSSDDWVAVKFTPGLCD